MSRRRVSVRARRGYFARTADGAPALEPYVLALAQALDLAAPASDFAHSVSAQLLPGPPGPREVQLAVQVPLHALRFDYDQAERRYRAHFSALVVVRDEAGRVVGRLSHDWPLAGPLVEAESVRNRTATVKRTLELPPADYVLETVVGDRVDGRLSIRRTPLSVPAPVGSP